MATGAGTRFDFNTSLLEQPTFRREFPRTVFIQSILGKIKPISIDNNKAYLESHVL